MVVLDSIGNNCREKNKVQKKFMIKFVGILREVFCLFLDYIIKGCGKLMNLLKKIIIV